MNTIEKNSIIPVHKDGNFAYNIVLEHSYDSLLLQLEPFEIKKKKICIVTDSTVNELYAESVRKILETEAAKVSVFVFPAGEQQKTLDTVQKLYEFLILNHFDRKDLLVALGGGVVGDLTGYTAATYLRGIQFIQMPTTLLSQVDSSIGGKTGVDFASYKNMVGAFHQPLLVYMNLKTLDTLNEEQFACGMGEILKHGLIKDGNYYEWLISHMSEISERESDVLTEMIYRSCCIKKEVVEKDPTEKGERALLNFGHTIGHAVEKVKNFSLLHGQCVALGCVAAAFISWKRNLIDTETFFEIRDMFVGFDLPISVDGIHSQQILDATKSDKKMESGAIKFVLLDEIGKARIDNTVTDEEMLEAIDYINIETGVMYGED